MARKGYRTPEMSASGLLDIFADSYGDGDIRALAQEPVQNAKDACCGGQVVHVEYRLVRRLGFDGNAFLLTVTDQGTTGLCGKTDPTTNELENATETERQQLKWYHFERLFDSNKGSAHIGSRGWGKSIFLYCSHIPGQQRDMMMLYDTLLQDGEYRFGNITVLNDNFGVLDRPLLNDEGRQVVSAQTYVTPDESIRLPLKLEPLRIPGARIVVPYLSERSIDSLRDGSLTSWLQYLWWRPIAAGRLTITIVDEELETCQTIDEPPCWGGDIWSSDATTPGEIHRLYQGCHMQILENKQLGQGCTVKRLALLYDETLHDQPMPDDGPDYFGIQMFRAGQCIETYWDFDFIQPKDKPGFRAFVEFDENTDAKLRKVEKAQHDGFYKRGIVKKAIQPFINDKMREFASGIGLIKSQDTNDAAPSEEDRRTSQFVFDRLLSDATGDIPNENQDNVAGDETDKPWEVDVLLSYPNPNTSRVDWGERITNIRFVANSRPQTLRPKTRYVLEWQAPQEKYVKLLSKPAKNSTEYGLGYRVLTQHEVKEHHIICPEPGIYRIRAAVYEGQRLVAKRARRIHVEMNPPEPQENPYAVSISVENETALGELRIESGDILSLQINGRNRTHDDVSGRLLMRTKEGLILLPNIHFSMPGKRHGENDRRHMLHRMRIHVIRGELDETTQDSEITSLPLEPGRRVIQAYLLDGSETLAFGTHTLHFESEPTQGRGSNPFELWNVVDGISPPMWELKMMESKLRYPADYPLHTEFPQESASDSSDEHNPFMLEITINGLPEWALEPLLEDKADPTNLESLRNAKPDLIDDAAWDMYMERLSELEVYMKQCQEDRSVSPIEFALIWRQTVAAIYQVLKP